MLFFADLILVACVLRSAVCLAGSGQGELDSVSGCGGDGQNAGVGGRRARVWCVGGFAPQTNTHVLFLAYSELTTPPHPFLVHRLLSVSLPWLVASAREPTRPSEAGVFCFFLSRELQTHF